MCHRDLKPDNLVVTENLDSLTIVDFNVAVKFTKDKPIEGATGFKHWSAPETRTQLTYDELSDEYSLGLILWNLSTGEKPSEDLTHN